MQEACPHIHPSFIWPSLGGEGELELDLVDSRSLIGRRLANILKNPVRNAVASFEAEAGRVKRQTGGGGLSTLATSRRTPAFLRRALDGLSLKVQFTRLQYRSRDGVVGC